MEMGTNDILDDIISTLDPEDVPVEYIIMARIVDPSGTERIIRDPDELSRMLSDPASRRGEVRVILDAKKIKRDIIRQLTEIYAEVNRRLARDD
jgi:hypothetical protein